MAAPLTHAFVVRVSATHPFETEKLAERIKQGIADEFFYGGPDAELAHIEVTDGYVYPGQL